MGTSYSTNKNHIDFIDKKKLDGINYYLAKLIIDKNIKQNKNNIYHIPLYGLINTIKVSIIPKYNFKKMNIFKITQTSKIDKEIKTKKIIRKTSLNLNDLAQKLKYKIFINNMKSEKEYKFGDEIIFNSDFNPTSLSKIENKKLYKYNELFSNRNIFEECLYFDKTDEMFKIQIINPKEHPLLQSKFHKDFKYKLSIIISYTNIISNFNKYNYKFIIDNPFNETLNTSYINNMLKYYF